MSAYVYVVTKGSYSDYSIDGIYSTPEAAEAHRKLIYDENNVEIWELDKLKNNFEKGLSPYRVNMKTNGDSRVSSENYLYDISEKNSWVAWLSQNGSLLEERCFIVLAKSEKHAVKICNEYRAQLIENGNWFKKTDGWEAL